MGSISVQKKINIVGIGIIASVLFFLLVYTVFARTLTLASNNFTLLFLVITLELIAFVSSIAISIWQTDDLPDKVVIKTAFVSFVINLGVISILSYGTLYILYPKVFKNLTFIEEILNFPTVLLYFSIYVLGHPVYLFILSIITYHLLFIIILELYYPKEVKKA